ncbi:cold-shock protein [Anopheles sinensis]|uniref:Cold-shock protein n=1 Tax=Anopheles sinensis TaxID=74873 RepID=A0A084VHQ0_ANOSI|nr:cold-shock protein [Anopheles sinensis]
MKMLLLLHKADGIYALPDAGMRYVCEKNVAKFSHPSECNVISLPHIGSQPEGNNGYEKHPVAKLSSNRHHRKLGGFKMKPKSPELK